MLKGRYNVYETDSGIYDLRDSHTELNYPFTELTFIGRATARNTTATNNVEIDVSSVASSGDFIIICAANDEGANNASGEMELVDASDDSALNGGVLLADSSSDTDPNNNTAKPHMAFFYWTYDGVTTPKVLLKNNNSNTATALVFRGTLNSVAIGSATCINKGTISATKESATVPLLTTRLKVGFQCDRINGTITNVDLSSNLTGQTGYTFYDGNNQPDSSDTMDDAYLILGPNDTDADVTLSNNNDRNITAAFASLNIT